MTRIQSARNSIILFLSLAALSSCSFSRDKDAAPAPDMAGIDHTYYDAHGNLVLPAGRIPGYNTINQLILTPHCAECHMNGKSSGGVALDSYANAKSALTQIYQAVSVSQSMPEGSTTSAVEQSLVTAWYDAGGPENDIVTGGGPLPKPVCAPGVAADFYDSNCNPVLPAGVYPGYNTLKALVLSNNCLGCHSQGNSKHTLLDDFAHAKAEYDDIGKAIFKGKFMPPNGKLSDNERALIGAWLQADGPENDVAAADLPNPKPLPTPEPIASPAPEPILSYQDMYTLIFNPRCIGCHNVNHDSAGIRVDDYALVKKFADKIEKEISGGTMPPKRAGGALPPNEQAFVKAWFDAGEPEFDSPEATLAPVTPSVIPSGTPTIDFLGY
jgi:mono/diheme cytochrome c family protein